MNLEASLCISVGVPKLKFINFGQSSETLTVSLVRLLTSCLYHFSCRNQTNIHAKLQSSFDTMQLNNHIKECVDKVQTVELKSRRSLRHVSVTSCLAIIVPI